jgi:hypothetical protein
MNSMSSALAIGMISRPMLPEYHNLFRLSVKDGTLGPYSLDSRKQSTAGSSLDPHARCSDLDPSTLLVLRIVALAKLGGWESMEQGARLSILARKNFFYTSF